MDSQPSPEAGTFTLQMPPVLLCCCCGGQIDRTRRPKVARWWRTVVYMGMVLIICPRHLDYGYLKLAHPLTVADGARFVSSLKAAVDVAVANVVTAGQN